MSLWRPKINSSTAEVMNNASRSKIEYFLMLRIPKHISENIDEQVNKISQIEFEQSCHSVSLTLTVHLISLILWAFAWRSNPTTSVTDVLFQLAPCSVLLSGPYDTSPPLQPLRSNRTSILWPDPCVSISCPSLLQQLHHWLGKLTPTKWTPTLPVPGALFGA